MANFLAINVKTTSEVDLVKPLTTYIDSVYNTSEDNKAEITEAVQELNKLRSKAVCSPLDKHQSALDVLTRYYDQLVAIENKIVISATQNPVVFKWRDAFDKGTFFFSKASLTLSDGSFERAAVLFNCGALMSQIAASQPLHTDEELKTAAKLFKQSAGIFDHLSKTVLGMVQQDPTPDLMPDTLSALSTLMVAQAQEAVYVKASSDKMKSSALVKIAAQTADFYGEANKLMSKDTVKGLFEKEFFNTVVGKNLGYQALSQFHQGEVCGEEKIIGEQLSRLAEAIKLGEQANKYSPVLGDRLAPIQKAYTLAKKDNDFIYHERIPDFRSLPLLPRAVLAKPTPVEHPMSPRFKDMFSSLVPVQVHNAMQAYEVKKGEVVKMETGRMREHTQLMNGILASLNLPAALDDVTSMETLPESIKQKSAKVKQSGGATELQRLFKELPVLFKRNDEILNETNRVLSEEKESDDNLRRQFGTKWTRMSSEQLTGPLAQEIGKYRGILHTASNADKMVVGKYEAHREGIELLSKNEVELRSAIPGQASHSTGGASESVQNLKRLMAEIQEIKVERERLEKDLKAVKCDIASDFLQAMAESQLLNEEQMSKEKIIQIYGPVRQKVEESVKRQDSVMEQVQVWNNKFMSEKSSSASGAERERVLKTLATAHDAFLELKGNLEEGTKFYNDLTPILVKLQQKVSDFAFARQTEKEDLMRQVQQNIIGGGSGSSGAAAPPRPPPPAPRTTSTASNPFDSSDIESPIPPPRMINPNAAMPSAPAPQQQAPPPQVAPQAAPQLPPYYSHAVPYGQPQPMFYHQPNYAVPYPTYPGAYQAAPMYSQFPPNPQGQNPFQPAYQPPNPPQ